MRPRPPREDRMAAEALLMEVLKACNAASPAPMYPMEFAAQSGLERAILDEALDHLRLRGLVRLTDWVQGKGQGYALTSQGAMALQDPKVLKRAPVPQEEAPEPARNLRTGTAWE